MNDRLSILGRVTAGVAHDLANYLGMVDLSLAMLARDTRKGEREDRIAAAREATQRALSLTGCLLEYARGGTPAPALVDLAVRVRRVLDLFGRVIPDGISVVMNLTADPPPITGVAAELEQLILNLVLNACDAMPRGGALGLTVRASDATVSLEVADSGSGIPAAVGDIGAAPAPSSKAGRTGGGLGLGIVHCVAERHRASLQMAPRPGGGTVVTVSFPRAKPAAAALAGSSTEGVPCCG
ncbi:MAG TPA: ATP-binding protein [Polyangia bacterium]|jgi:hypothetical protein